MHEKFQGMITGFMDKCVELGLELPFLMITAGTNGSFTVARIDGKQNECLAEHTVAQGFTLPINLVASDATGRLVSGKITKEGLTTYH